MPNVVHDDTHEIDLSPFSALIGEDVVSFIFGNAPRKVLTRVASALEHYVRSEKLEGIDEEMGAIRLVAAEEELVVAIFEWLKLHSDSFPEHGDFVRKFKNHRVKLAFHPVLVQFRFVIGDMLRDGFTLAGMEGILNWTAKPVVDGRQIRLALYAENGEELIRHDPFGIDISSGDLHAQDVVPLLFQDLVEIMKEQHGMTPKQFLVARAEFRNQILYATNAGTPRRLGDSLIGLREQSEQTLHDLLWILALIVGGKPPSKQWGIASQFIGVYRLALVEAGILNADNTVAGACMDARRIHDTDQAGAANGTASECSAA